MTLGRIRLLPDALLSVPVFGLSLLWAALVQVVDGAGTGEALGDIAVRLVLLLPIQILMFVFPFVTWRVVCPHASPRSATWLLLISIVVGAAVRGLAFGLLLFGAGVTQSPEVVFRALASINHQAVVAVLLWLLVSEVRGLQSRRRQLVAERDQLLALQRSAQRDLEQLGDRATEGIRRSVLESLDGFRVLGSSELLGRLRVTIDDVVRPLSHQLAAQKPAWVPPPPSIEKMKVDWWLAAREGLDAARIHPVIVTVLLIWIGLPRHLFTYGPARTAALVATAIIAIPAFLLSRKAAIRLAADCGAGTRAAAFVCAVVSSGAVLGLGTLSYMNDQPQPLLYVVAAPLLALLIAGPLAVAEAARDQNLELESDLRATTASLRWTIARAREQHRQQERALVHALHGRVQASLAAAFVRLDRAVAQGDDNEALRDALRAEILEAVAGLDAPDSGPDPVDQVIALTQSNWNGAVTLTFSVEPHAKQALANDLVCARSVNDLIPELVFNSVRHGGASTIDVGLGIREPTILTLTVVDNGCRDLVAAPHGLGSALLNEASIVWTRSRCGDSTTTTCLLPLLSPTSP